MINDNWNARLLAPGPPRRPAGGLGGPRRSANNGPAGGSTEINHSGGKSNERLIRWPASWAQANPGGAPRPAGKWRTKRQQQFVSARLADEQSVGAPPGTARPAEQPARRATADTLSGRAVDTRALKCRVERDLYLDFEEYQHYTCAFCYNQVPRVSFKRKLLYKKEARIWLYDEQLRRALLPNETQLIKATFKDESIYEKWHACCRHAVDCCLGNAASLPATRDPLTGALVDDRARSDQCPATWDGLTCWQNAPAGRVVWRECPRHVYFLSFEPACTGSVAKQCFANGSWFIRNDHEWSDYSHCAVLPIYVRRMVFSVVWHIISALVITPALLTINKFSNRGGNKRVKILRNMLFWLLVNSYIQATQKSAIVSGLFEADRSRAEETPLPPPSAASSSSSASSSVSSGATSAPLGVTFANATGRLGSGDTGAGRALAADRFARSIFDDSAAIVGQTGAGDGRSRFNSSVENNFSHKNDEHFSELKLADEPDGLFMRHRRAIDDKTRDNFSSAEGFVANPSGAEPWRDAAAAGGSSETSIMGNHHDDWKQVIDEQTGAGAGSPQTSSRCRRNAKQPDGSARGAGAARRQRSAMVVFFCWFLVVASRIVRLMGYSWMFTGAIYLCSALHFAPAEPPAQFIRILMFLTNAFPILIALIYVTSRTIAEPSPLNIIFKVPYYKLTGDQDNVDYLWATQLECWFDQSKYESIEEIADLPNLILVCLNVGLFIITLVILCRISRPGSTRPDMSPLTYFKAAGTLVVLYGGHYALLAYRPNAEGCTYDTLMFYAFLFVDGIQGIAVSYVFCYRTQEGKEIIGKYWRTRHQRLPLKACGCFGCAGPNVKLQDNGHLKSNNRSNQSTRSNNSACNGHETVTELININDAAPGTNHQF